MAIGCFRKILVGLMVAFEYSENGTCAKSLTSESDLPNREKTGRRIVLRVLFGPCAQCVNNEG